MDSAATLKGENGQDSEATGLSVLDVVKHSVRTIIESLSAQDKLSIVEFNNAGKLILASRAMDEAGKQAAIAVVEKLRPDGCTNIWDGLVKGLQHLQQHAKPGDNSQVLLLTDGSPTEHPPGGYGPALTKYRAEHKFQCSISTFGFGYSLDSVLLVNMANIGNGKY